MLRSSLSLVLLLPGVCGTFLAPVSLGWAGWSPWTECSKQCGGGVQRQLRRCLDTKCSGPAVRYRVCGTGECQVQQRQPRDTVCGGEAIVSRQQCEVVCRSRSSGATFLWRVADGAECEPAGGRDAAGGRAVCAQGTCQTVGCDDVIGSTLRFDACGECGGRGDGCDSAQFVWRQTGEWTECPTDCEQAAKREGAHSTEDARSSMPISVCVNAATGRVVPERLCADRPRPRADKRPCPPMICARSCRWLASDWSECAPLCGGGQRTRSVYCVQHSHNVTINVHPRYCVAHPKPNASEPCGESQCGRWEAGEWSGCSAHCGHGRRERTVECVGGTDCPLESRPTPHEECYGGAPCSAEPQALTMSDNSIEWSDRRYLDSSTWNPGEAGIGSSPRLVAGAWGPCSSSCGAGVATRSVECVALHPITANIIKLAESDCQGLPQPSLFQPCETRACPLQEDSKDTPDASTYRWEHGDWAACSASCLGGKQKAQLKCVEAASGRTVAWSQCDARRRPAERVRACNNQPCPPLWQVGAFGECSSSCGGGERWRTVRCVRPVSRSGGADAHLILPDSSCPRPKPAETQQCAAVACPARWITSEWSECSVSCGAGERRRRVWCEARDGKGRAERRAESDCDGARPPAEQMCSLGPCSAPAEMKSNRVFEQSEGEKKLTLGIGGVATLYQGTSVKVKCPRKNYDKKKIYWMKDGRRIRNDAHMKVSSNGNLRIFHARMEDAGLYACFTDTPQGNVTLRFKYRDEAHHPNSVLHSNRVLPLQPAKQFNMSMLDTLLVETSDDVSLARELEPFRHMLRASYDIGAWSECHQKECGVHGFQARETACYVSVTSGSGSRRADDAVCIALGHTRPPATRPCHRPDCPKWEAGEWSECSTSKCVRDSYAQQRRQLRCVAGNGTEVDQASCDRSARPKHKKECSNVGCKAEWRSGEWGDCSANCGTGGVQLRLLQCVWASTGKAAGRSCEGQRRPPAARACVSPLQPFPPCRSSEEENAPSALPLMDQACEDQSRFCDIIKLFHSCDSEEVRQRCCAACARLEARA